MTTTITNLEKYVDYLIEQLEKNNVNYEIFETFQLREAEQNKQKISLSKDSNKSQQSINVQADQVQKISSKLKTNMIQPLTGSLVERYCRQMLLKQISYQGQEKIIHAKIALIGSGGIGCPVALYLAGAGVGTLGLFDSDVVDVTNLHRQIGHQNKNVGVKKTQSLKQTLIAFNPNIKINQHEFITVNTCHELDQYDFVIDGSDNPECRYIVNDYCMKINKKLLSGACIGWEGQVTCYGGGDNNPCYRCIWGNDQKTFGGCSTLGVVGMLPGYVGIVLAIEAIKIILTGKSSLEGNLLTYESRTANFRKMKLRQRVKQCIGCGQNKLDMKEYDYTKHAICKPNLVNLPIVPETTWPQYISSSSNSPILDVRPSNQFEIVHLSNMKNIPHQKLVLMNQQQLKQALLQKNLLNNDESPILVSCNRGVMSRRAVDLLIKAGYKAVSIKGGITQYSNKIDNDVPKL